MLMLVLLLQALQVCSREGISGKRSCAWLTNRSLGEDSSTRELRILCEDHLLWWQRVWWGVSFVVVRDDD